MTGNGVELVNGGNEGTVEVKSSPLVIRPVSIKTLFLKYASTKERIFLFFGFFCIYFF